MKSCVIFKKISKKIQYTEQTHSKRFQTMDFKKLKLFIHLSLAFKKNNFYYFYVKDFNSIMKKMIYLVIQLFLKF